MKTILVPVDFSDVTPKLADAAAKMAEKFQGKVILLHSASGEGSLAQGLMPTPITSNTGVENARRRLHEIKARLAALPLEVEVVLFDGGSPLKNIAAECESRGVDLVIMGTHGHRSLHDRLVGSVTAGMIKLAKWPVMMMPSP